jgi:uncharacterized Zn-binding protein involved in type VI secretion
MAGLQAGLSGQGFYGSHDIHTPVTFTTAGTAFSENVVINGRPVHRLGDKSENHTIPIPPGTWHPEFIVDGIPSVFVNGRPIARLGSTTTNGASVLLGSHSVYLSGPPQVWEMDQLASEFDIDISENT